MLATMTKTPQLLNLGIAVTALRRADRLYVGRGEVASDPLSGAAKRSWSADQPGGGSGPGGGGGGGGWLLPPMVTRSRPEPERPPQPSR